MGSLNPLNRETVGTIKTVGESESHKTIEPIKTKNKGVRKANPFGNKKER
jgi:hypothetical protein